MEKPVHVLEVVGEIDHPTGGYDQGRITVHLLTDGDIELKVANTGRGNYTCQSFNEDEVAQISVVLLRAVELRNRKFSRHKA